MSLISDLQNIQKKVQWFVLIEVRKCRDFGFGRILIVSSWKFLEVFYAVKLWSASVRQNGCNMRTVETRGVRGTQAWHAITRTHSKLKPSGKVKCCFLYVFFLFRWYLGLIGSLKNLFQKSDFRPRSYRTVARGFRRNT